MNKKWMLSLALAISVSVMTACGGDNGEQSGENNEKTEETNQEESGEAKENAENAQEPEMPDPKLDDVPDVVAQVNGEEITKKEFEPIYVNQLNSYAMQGMYSEEQDKDGEMQQQLQKQVVDLMVGQELLTQEINNRDLSVSEEEVNKELATFKEGFESEEQFQEVLKSNDISEEDIVKDLETKIKMDKLLVNEAGEIKVTDEEIQKQYDQLAQMQGDGENAQKLPSLEDIKPQLESQLKQQKESEELNKIVEDLREKGEVTVNI